MKALAISLPVIEKKPYQASTALIGGVSLTFMIIASSVYPVFGKQLTTAFSPLSLLFIGEMMGGLFVLMSFGLIPLLQKTLSMPKKKLLLLMFIGLTSGVVAPYLWFKGLHLTTSVNAGLFSRTEMIFLIVLSVFVLNEKISRYQFIALSIILFGILFVALQGFSVGITMKTGDIFIITSGLAYSVGGVFVKRDMHDVAPEVIIFVRALLATSFFLAVSPFIHSTLVSEFRAMPSELMLVLLCYGFISKFLGIYSFHEAIEILKVSTVSMFSTLAVVGSIVFAALYLGEQIHLYQLIGAGFIVFGVLMMQKVGMHKNDKVHEHHMKQHHMHSL